jgi:signal peptidase I
MVVFETTGEIQRRCMEGGTFVKRIIGLPGETVVINGDGLVSIDGRRLDESDYLDAGRRGGTFGAWRMGEGQYFLMGDNRRASCDSRTWGPLPEDRIVGEVFGVYWPPQRIGLAAILAAVLWPLSFVRGRSR